MPVVWVSFKQSQKFMVTHKELDSYQTFFYIKYKYTNTNVQQYVTDPLYAANIFNDYFSSIARKTKAIIKFSNI